ncbi:polysaccharide deacetylase family protein [Accumulibacter sp.]|uniref:polysaccharide deacetylase family protein n=1 Tax=Accumulibacter sp. TaxID=2053492 RepID=UPI00262115F7|nr:polysaccharide deacetylase family protein [Accumulibacter sp.]
MKRIALKIDVDTCRGTLVGVPFLLELLPRLGASATFFFSLGPDCSGREARQSSPCRYYDFSARLDGLILPAPDIGTRAADIMRQARDAGFEVAIHAWNRVLWEDKVLSADNPWIEVEMTHAWRRFEAIFGQPATAHGAAGWRMSRHALRLTQRLGFGYASDCRGKYPFFPVIDGEIVRCPQVPTTLPTLDELLLTGAASAEQAVERILELSARIRGDHVFTLRAELEGIRFRSAFELLLAEWQQRGHQLIALRDVLAARNIAQLPRHAVVFAGVPGRTGPRLLQGKSFLEGERDQ